MIIFFAGPMSLKIYIVKLENFRMKHFTFIKMLVFGRKQFSFQFIKKPFFSQKSLSLLGSAGFISEIIKKPQLQAASG